MTNIPKLSRSAEMRICALTPPRLRYDDSSENTGDEPLRVTSEILATIDDVERIVREHCAALRQLAVCAHNEAQARQDAIQQYRMMADNYNDAAPIEDRISPDQQDANEYDAENHAVQLSLGVMDSGTT